MISLHNKKSLKIYTKGVLKRPENAGVIYKFRGDNLYHQKSYTEALDLYKEGLGFIFLCFIFEILV
jgi:hypothetical protein